MGAVPAPHSSPRASRDRAWQWSGTDALDRVREHGGWRAVARAHAWHDPAADREHDPPHEKGAYKLPHHDVVDGLLRVVWRGVVSAMTVVNGARGGVGVPVRDARRVYVHLARHYRQFGEEPPEFHGG
jgi:hypothetical protein